jgi:hypothetical protein
VRVSSTSTGARGRAQFRQLAIGAPSLAASRKRAALLRPEYGLASESVDCACATLRAVLAQTALFDVRVSAGRIVEGHGDLRPEHVCLQGEPQIIDCLEFSRRLRRLDPLDELGYLALECERLGAPGIGAAILEAYRALSGDPAPARLQHAYQAYRAAVRAMLAIRHLDDPAVADRGEVDRARPRLRRARLRPRPQVRRRSAPKLGQRAARMKPRDRLGEQRGDR